MVLGEVLVCFRFDAIYLYSDISVYFEDGPPVGFAVPVLKPDLVEAELRGDGEVAQDDVEALVGEGSREGVAQQLLVLDVERNVVLVANHAQRVVERRVVEHDFRFFRHLE